MLARWLKGVAARADAQVERLWRPLSAKLGREQPGSIICYRGWAAESCAYFGGRVLANPPRLAITDDAGWSVNLRDTYRRWESDEVPGVTVRARLQGYEQTTGSDNEGYLRFRLPLSARLSGGYWLRASVDAISTDGGRPVDIQADCELINPGAEARFGIISDMDDTVIETGITNLLTAARLTFLHNARTRKAFDGVAGLYRALHTESADGAGPPLNPIFYVSSSPWNLYDLLDEFLVYNHIPRGPLLLQDYGVDENKFITGGHGHKLRKARRILADYPQLPFILFGDSGQQDAELYAQLAEEQPGRVLAICIRDVTTILHGDRTQTARLHLQRAQAAGVPAWLVADSADAARRLIALGVLSADALPHIERECEADLRHKRR